ncbi:MAG: O-antigen ligase family protein [Acidobacteria bacterium]|nr:O-antigen ligase family protein [Acidobacteriota bacterium]
MTSDAVRKIFGRAAFWCAAGAAVAVMFSIAACHILLALSFVLLLLSDVPLRFPPVKLPLALFFLGTVISLVLSDDPSAGRPQLRKFFVYLMLLVVASTFHRLADVRRLIIVWGGVGALAALKSFVQFFTKREEARALGVEFYTHYIADRTTGFMSHWMTFGGEQMMVLLMLAALLLFAPLRRHALLLWIGAALIGGSLVLNLTRSIWAATAAGGAYLVARWRPRLLLLAPVLLALGFWLAPPSVRQRAVSTYQPGAADSNLHRIVTWRTGWEMIKAHPWFGVGPQHVGLQFKQYVPRDFAELPAGWYGHLHNIYLQFAAERGLPTMLALLWMLGRILRDFWRGARAAPSPDARAILSGGFAVILAILIAGMFEHNLGDSEVLTMFLTVVGLGYAALWAKDAEPA